MSEQWQFYKSVPCTLDVLVLDIWKPAPNPDYPEGHAPGNTFNNGCAFSLTVDPAYPVTNPRHFMIGWGCYGVHVNLVQGAKRQLMNWLEAQIGNRSSDMVPFPITPETQVEILKLPPCRMCGNPLFKAKEAKPDPRAVTDYSKMFDVRDVDLSKPLPFKS